MEKIATNVLTKNIQQMIWEYPTILSNRAQCLHYLFCVNGIGMEWVDGVLAHSYNAYENNDHSLFKNEETELIEAVCGIPEEYLNHEAVLDIKARRLIWVRRHNNKINFCRENAEHLARVDEPLNRIYPLCEYARMATVPDDVHIDYLNGVKDMIAIVFNTPINLDYRYSQSDRQHNINFASNILTQLCDRFPERYPQEPTSYDEWEDRL
jgi:hypothetical protein